MTKKLYFFALATKDFWLEKEATEEVLRERTQNYKSKGKQVDFWLVENPTFLDHYTDVLEKKVLGKEKDQNKILALITTDINFVIWIKVRYQNVINGYFSAPTRWVPSPLLSRNVPCSQY